MSRTNVRVCRLLAFAAVAAIVVLAASPGAYAQADTLKVNYYIRAGVSGVPDAAVHIVNPGLAAAGNLCANIYVFDPSEELKECCSCLITPDGLLTFSVNSELTNNPNNGVHASTGAIKIISSDPIGGVCGAPVAENPTPDPTLRAWITHLYPNSALPAVFTPTEEEFEDATLSAGELASLNDLCDSINDNASGKGLCAKARAECAPH